MPTIPDSLQAGLSAETLWIVRPLLDEPLAPVEELRREVEEYTAHIREVAFDSEFIDGELGEAIGRCCLALLDGLGQPPQSTEHQLVQVACRYFALEEDTYADLGSLLGFDDDVEVLNVVLRILGREDLLVHLL
jgi:hypothetical protein